MAVSLHTARCVEAGGLNRMGGRIAIARCLVLALLLIGFGIGRASDIATKPPSPFRCRQPTTSSEEGYFSLGDSATVLAKPGSELLSIPDSTARAQGDNCAPGVTWAGIVEAGARQVKVKS